MVKHKIKYKKRKKELIIKKIKNIHLEDKHKDDEEIELEKQYIENENDTNETQSYKTRCPNLVTEQIEIIRELDDGGKIKVQFPRSTCKEMDGYVSCCGNLIYCEKNNKNKDDKKSKFGKDDKLAVEIQKVKKEQKKQNKKKDKE